jgi:hypothetical protein
MAWSLYGLARSALRIDRCQRGDLFAFRCGKNSGTRCGSFCGSVRQECFQILFNGAEGYFACKERRELLRAKHFFDG